MPVHDDPQHAHWPHMTCFRGHPSRAWLEAKCLKWAVAENIGRAPHYIFWFDRNVDIVKNTTFGKVWNEHACIARHSHSAVAFGTYDAYHYGLGSAGLLTRCADAFS